MSGHDLHYIRIYIGYMHAYFAMNRVDKIASFANRYERTVLIVI